MPIVINGSGTITGVSTGGLPDGIVDADMLAANAVTTGKILDATIASGDLASGAITSGAMPTGSILEVKAENMTSGYDSSTATDIALGSGVTFSTVNAGETILAVVMGGGLTLHRGTNNTDGIATVEIGGTKTYGGKNYAGVSGDYDWYAAGVCQGHKYYSSAGSSILVRAYGHKNAGTYTSWNAASGYSIQLVAYRIKGQL
jgi:hypothetical protein